MFPGAELEALRNRAGLSASTESVLESQSPASSKEDTSNIQTFNQADCQSQLSALLEDQKVVFKSESSEISDRSKLVCLTHWLM